MSNHYRRMARAAAYVLAAGLIAAVVTASGRANTHTAGSEGASVCKPILATGLRSFSPLEAIAQEEAVAKWSRGVSRRYGDTFSIWDLARDKRLSCRRQHGVSICRAIARPCG